MIVVYKVKLHSSWSIMKTYDDVRLTDI